METTTNNLLVGSTWHDIAVIKNKIIINSIRVYDRLVKVLIQGTNFVVIDVRSIGLYTQDGVFKTQMSSPKNIRKVFSLSDDRILIISNEQFMIYESTI